MDVAEFKTNLSKCETDSALVDFCRMSFLHGTPSVFKGKEGEFYSFRKKIAACFGVSFHEIYIVGSAKLGFSPIKNYKPFDLDSDVDVSIISDALFNRIMDEVSKYQMDRRASLISVSEKDLKRYHKFLEYTAIGWIRPDMLPASMHTDNIKKDWFDFFRSISYGKSEVGNYKVSAGVFKNYDHLERYTITSIAEAKKALDVEASCL